MIFHDALRRHVGRTSVCGWVFVVLFTLGCGSKGAVTLTAQIENPTATPTKAALGMALDGSFDLRLDLGPEAPQSTMVTPGVLALRNDTAVLVPSVDVDYGESPPIEIKVGGTKTVPGNLNRFSKVYDASAYDALCAGDVWYTLTLSDTLGGNSTTESAKFKPSCP